MGLVCAQRLSASKVSALARAKSSPLRGYPVLNAFRHQRFLHRPRRDRTRRRSPSTCAQRLSASKVSARIDPVTAATLAVGCSTPFGIKGFCTSSGGAGRTWNGCAQRLSASKVSAQWWKRRYLENHRVLNAFRHQRFLHRRPHAAVQGRGSCAQRLSASKVSALESAAAAGDAGGSAQRLSASKVSAPASDGSGGAHGSVVLNAFRHQRFLHMRPARPPRRTLKVLNAFRHQRFLHPDVYHLAVHGGIWCSTPFGIKGFCTGRGKRHQGGAWWVLNAFRHQRFLHIAPVPPGDGSHRVLNAFRHQRFLHSARGSFGFQRHQLVLNAFRHQRFLHSASGSGRWPNTRAQRLSASKVSAPSTLFANEPFALCSTPFGIKGFCT